jgi:hypothetical protein
VRRSGAWLLALVGTALLAVVIGGTRLPRAPEQGRGAIPSTSPTAVASQGDPSTSPTAGPSPGDSLEAVLTNSYFAKPGVDGWLIGNFTDAVREVPLGSRGQISYVWDRLFAYQLLDGSWSFGFVDIATGQIESAATIDTTYLSGAATTDVSGDRIFYQLGDGVRGDGGLHVLGLRTDQSEVVLAGKGPTEPLRHGLEWSPSGRTLLSTSCEEETCGADVIDVGRMEARHIDAPFLAQSLTDSHVLGRTAESDANGDRWQVVDIDTAEMRAVADQWITAAGHGFAIDDDRFVVSGLGESRNRYFVVVVNVASGDERLLLDEPYELGVTLQLRVDLVNPRWALLSAEPLGSLVVNADRDRVAVLDLDTGEVLEGAASVP